MQKGASGVQHLVGVLCVAICFFNENQTVAFTLVSLISVNGDIVVDVHVVYCVHMDVHHIVNIHHVVNIHHDVNTHHVV